MTDKPKPKSAIKHNGALTIKKLKELGCFEGKEHSKKDLQMSIETNKALSGMLDPENISVAQSIAMDIEKNRHLLETINRPPEMSLENKYKSIPSLQFDDSISEKTFEAIKEQNNILKERNDMLNEQAEDSDRKFRVSLYLNILLAIIALVSIWLAWIK